MISDSGLWKVVFRDGNESNYGNIKAITIYKDNTGRKRVASGSADDRESSASLRNELIKNDITQKRAWGEVSDKMERYLITKYGNNIAIPNTFTSDLLPHKEVILFDDGYHYARKLGDHYHAKVLVGYTSDKQLNKKIEDSKTTKYVPLSDKIKDKVNQLNNRE